jgi:ankyrin repeat protein
MRYLYFFTYIFLSFNIYTTHAGENSNQIWLAKKIAEGNKIDLAKIVRLFYYDKKTSWLMAMIAVCQKNETVLSLFINKGIDPTHIPYGKKSSALSLAISKVPENKNLLTLPSKTTENCVWIIINRSGVNKIDDLGNTPAHYAAYYGKSGILSKIWKREGNLNIHNKLGYTPLAYAIHNKEFVTALFLIQTLGKNAVDDLGNTAAHYAAGFGRVDLLEKLILDDADLQIINKNGETPQVLANKHGHTDSALLIAETLGIDKMIDCYGNTAVHYAAVFGKIEILKALLRKDKNINLTAPNNNQETPLMLACKYGHVDVALFLTDLLKNNNKVDKVSKPVHYAAKFGHTKLLKQLISQDFPSNGYLTSFDELDKTPLALACEHGHINTVLFITRMLGIDVQDKSGNTAAFYAARFNQVKILEALGGANLNPGNNAHQSPLLIAIQSKNNEASLFIANKLGINSFLDVLKNTPIHLVAMFGTREMYQNFIYAGADPALPNVLKETAAQIRFRRFFL